MGKDVMVGDLMVIDFHSKHLTPEIQAWKEQAAVPFAASCARQIWYGTEDDFRDFPYPENRDAVKTLKGAEGYSALLRVLSGFESNRLGETHVKSQFDEGWRCFNDEHPDKAEGYQRLIGMLREDVNFIRNDIASAFKYQRHEMSARDLSGQKKGEELLVIGSVSKAGIVSAFTEGIIRVSENRQKNNDHFLRVTHPDPDTLQTMRNALLQMKQDKKLRTNIEFVDFDLIGKLMDLSDRVYVDLPMGSDPEGEAQIIAAWRDRTRNDNTLTHLRGDPHNRALSTSLWAEADLDNYFSPEDIRHDMAERGRNNRKVLENADAAFDMCGQLRLEGRKPKNCIVQSDDLTLTLKGQGAQPEAEPA